MSEEKNDKLKEFIERTNDLEAELEVEVTKWNNVIVEMASGLKGRIELIIDVQAEILSNKQMVVDKIRMYSLMLHKLNSSIKGMKKTRFEFYSTKYEIQVKNDSSKKGLIEADIAKFQYKADMLSNHIIYLQNTASDLDSLNYAVKNRIDLLNILGMS